MKVFIIGWFFCFFVYGETQVYRGEAKIDGKVVYREIHTVQWEDSKPKTSTTEYINPEGERIAVLTNIYGDEVNLPDYVMKDLVQKNTHGVRRQDNNIVMFNKNDDAKEETEKLDKSDGKGKLIVGGQGLHYYLVQNLEEVARKGEIDLYFLIPGKLDGYNFYLKVTDKSADKIKMDIEIDNWFLKLFAPKLSMEYDLVHKRLLKYKGLSNLKDSENKMMNVEITYSYEK